MGQFLHLSKEWVGGCHYRSSGLLLDFPGGSDGKRICPQCRRPGFNPWVGKIPLEKGMATHSSIAFRLQKCYAEAPKQVHAGVFLLRGKGLQTCSLPHPLLLSDLHFWAQLAKPGIWWSFCDLKTTKFYHSLQPIYVLSKCCKLHSMNYLNCL